MQCLCNISRRKWVMKIKLMFSTLINMKNLLQVDSITFDRFGKACPNYSGKFAMFLWYFKKEDVNEVKDLELAGSNTALTIYFTSNILPPLTLFFSHSGIHTKPFLHLITFLCKINSLFQVRLVPVKLVCLNSNRKAVGNFIAGFCRLPTVFAIPQKKTFWKFSLFRKIFTF